MAKGKLCEQSTIYAAFTHNFLSLVHSNSSSHVFCAYIWFCFNTCMFSFLCSVATGFLCSYLPPTCTWLVRQYTYQPVVSLSFDEIIADEYTSSLPTSNLTSSLVQRHLDQPIRFWNHTPGDDNWEAAIQITCGLHHWPWR